MDEPIRFETPINHHVVMIKSVLSGRDRQAIQMAISENMRGTLDNNDQIKVDDINLIQARIAGDNTTISRMVISVDDKTDSVLDMVLDMKEADCQAVINELNRIIKLSTLSQEKKTISPSNISSPPEVQNTA